MKYKLERGFPALLAIGAALALGVHSTSAQIKVACVGDSITAGNGLTSAQNYPSQLQALLGSGYTVGNFGYSGACVQKNSDIPYWNKTQYRQSKSFKPNIVIIMFGANDTRSGNWNASTFDSDYRSLIAQYQGLTTHPKVYICYTPPMYSGALPTFNPVFVENTLEPAIAAVSTAASVPLIDNDTPLINRPDLFQDGVHPTAAGAAIIAQRVANAINGLTPTNITSAAITTSGSPSSPGDTVTYTATISSANGTPTGSVIFALNDVPFSTNTLVGGTASVRSSTAPVGNNVVAVQYVSQGNYLGITHSVYQNVLSGNPVPSPWVSADVGTVGVAGFARYTNGTFTVSGSGADLWGAADAFQFVYQPGSGDCSVVARVASVQNTSSAAKVGVMIRESLNANSSHATVNVTPSGGIEFLSRTTTGGSGGGTSVSGLTAPYWVRIVRSGNTFTASRSPDGVTWTTIGSQSITMSSTTYIGLIVNSHADGTLCTGVLDNVTATP